MRDGETLSKEGAARGAIHILSANPQALFNHSFQQRKKFRQASCHLLGSLGYERGIEAQSLWSACALQNRYSSPEYHLFVAGGISSHILSLLSLLASPG
jgi:hypothetical protein